MVAEKIEEMKKEKKKKEVNQSCISFLIYFSGISAHAEKESQLNLKILLFFESYCAYLIILLSHHICVLFKPWSLFVVFCSKLSYLGENLISSVGIKKKIYIIMIFTSCL